MTAFLKNLCLFLVLFFPSSAATLSPNSLDCEARVDPVGVGSAVPRLSWKLKSDIVGDKQSAFEILAASSMEKLNAGVGDLWASGRVPSSQNSWVSYAGKPLRSFQQAWWKLRVWSKDGHPSEWSHASRWTMAIVNSADRKGTWISSRSNALRSGPMPLFRREFAIDRPIRRAMIVVSGLGAHDVRLNGTPVSDHVLAPAWTNYRHTVPYETFDVTAQVKSGRNAIAVMLGNGFYNVVGGRYSKFTGSFGVPRLWLQVHIELTDGTTTDVGTDNTWKMHSGPIVFSDAYGGEDYDSRLEQSGWDRPGFVDAQWQAAANIEAPGGELVATLSPPLKIHETFKPIRVTQPKPGVFIYDLGQNFSGWPKIEVQGNAGDTVHLTPGELLDSQGLVTQRSSGAPVSFSYILRGGGRETWSPRFSYYGFRYVQVEGAVPETQASSGKPRLHDLIGQFIYADAPVVGQFSSSNESLNTIHGLILAALKSNLQHVLTDCPHREKLGWLEVAHLMGPSMIYNFDLRTFLPKVVRDIREAQLTNGLIPDIAPEYVQFSSGFRDSPEWGSAGIMLPWMSWQWYKDRQPLADSYSSMSHYADYLQSQSKNGLLPFGLGDWFDIAPGPPGPSKLTPQGVTGTAMYIADLDILAKASSLLAHSAQATSFQQRSDAERAVFQQAFYKPNGTSYASGSQTALAMPLVFGIAPVARRQSIASKLADTVRRNGNHTTAGDVGYRYVIQALSTAGYNDLVFDMATEKTAPSYAGQIAAGATSLTEAWDANPNTSQNHLMLGHIEEWFYNGLLGIRPVFSDRGWNQVDIAPSCLSKLDWAKASWQSPTGLLSVEWSKQGDRLRFVLDIPPGLTATVHLPSASPNDLQSSGQPLSQHASVRMASHRSGMATLIVSSGHHELTTQSRPVHEEEQPRLDNSQK